MSTLASRERSRALLRSVVSLGLSTALVACGGGGSGADDTPAPAPVPAPVPAPAPTPAPSVTATIGAAGGTITGPDDVKIEIPAGALTVDTAITIRKSSDGSPAAYMGAAKTGMYEFTPHGLAFDVPVKVSMPSTANPFSSLLLTAGPSEEWTALAAESDGTRLTWSMSHFSWVWSYPCGGTGPGPLVCPGAHLNAVRTATPATALTHTSYYSDTVTAEADVKLALDFGSNIECVNPTLRVDFRKRPAPLVQGTPMSVTVNRVTLPGIGGTGYVWRGSLDQNRHYTFADNGTYDYGYFFTCKDANGFGAPTVGGGMSIKVDIAPPPAAPAAPVITQQPANVSVNAGATATFDVLATAANTLVINWERRESNSATFLPVAGTPITGGSRVATVAQAADNGAVYQARVCNALGAQQTCITSSPASLSLNTPPPPPTPTNALTRACGITTTGGLRCWGYNFQHYAGVASEEQAILVPTLLPGLNNVTDVSQGDNYVGCAVHDAGKVSCWGVFDAYAYDHSTTPVELPYVTGAIKVIADADQICWIKADHKVYCNTFTGPLMADGQVVENVVTYTNIDTGPCLLKTDGTVHCYRPVSSGSTTLTEYLSVPGYRSLAIAGRYNSVICGVLTSGSVLCWGSDQIQLGYFALDQTGSPGITNATGVIAMGFRNACVIVDGGKVKCWGTGVLGDGMPFANYSRPVEVSGLTDAIALSTSGFSACALRASGEVACWGTNAFGELGTGGPRDVLSLSPAVQPIGAVYAH
ncbi:hypothetical protein BH10PSE17_BH10PSE17_21120 [soil metagenome]